MCDENEYPDNAPSTNDQLNAIRIGFNRVDPLSAVVLVLLVFSIVPIGIIPHLWPASSAGKFLDHAMKSNVFFYVWAGLIMLLGWRIPFDRKRRALASCYVAIKKYDKAVASFAAYQRSKSQDDLIQCSLLLKETMPYLGQVPEVIAFAEAVNSAIERDFPLNIHTKVQSENLTSTLKFNKPERQPFHFLAPSLYR